MLVFESNKFKILQTLSLTLDKQFYQSILWKDTASTKNFVIFLFFAKFLNWILMKINVKIVSRNLIPLKW